MVLFVLCKLILQTCMCSHPVGLDVWFLVGPFVYFPILLHVCEVKARLRRLTWAFTGRLYVISTIISWAGSYFVPECCTYFWMTLHINKQNFCRYAYIFLDNSHSDWTEILSIINRLSILSFEKCSIIPFHQKSQFSNCSVMRTLCCYGNKF